MFKNLSVKLLPDAVAADETACVCCSYQVACDECTCTDTPTTPPGCEGCTDLPTCDPCTGGITDPPPACGPDTCTDDTHCIRTEPIVIKAFRSADVIRSELEFLREELRQRVGRPSDEAQPAYGGEPQSVEEIDQLREALLGAVAELDERRAIIEGTRSAE